MPVIPVSSVPQSRDGFYATNNQFQINGPKGFTEFKMLENDDLFMRVDLPGVQRNGVSLTLNNSKKALTMEAIAPKEHKYDSSPRKYSTVTSLVCDCCEISGFRSDMLDGVLRLHLSKKKIESSSIESHCACRPQGCRDSDPNDPAWSGQVLQPHPYVLTGPNTAFESKKLQNGAYYLRLDMPGVPKDSFRVAVKGGIVSVTGEAPSVGYDSGGRSYSGNVAMITWTPDFPSRRIKSIAKNGVIRLILPPV